MAALQTATLHFIEDRDETFFSAVESNYAHQHTLTVFMPASRCQLLVLKLPITCLTESSVQNIQLLKFWLSTLSDVVMRNECAGEKCIDPEIKGKQKYKTNS